MQNNFVISRVIAAAFAVLLVAGSANAQAVRQTARLDDSYVFEYVNPCTGEPLMVQTEVKTFTRLMADGNGGSHFHFNGHWQYRAVSPTTGAVYVGTETGNRSILLGSGGTVNEIYESVGRLVGKGNATDVHIHTFMKLTVTPDGRVATEMAGQTVDCR